MGNDKVLAIAPGNENSPEYKLYNAKLFSLNEILSFSEYLPTANDQEHYRKFDRAEFEQMAKAKEAQVPKIMVTEDEAKKLYIELGRFKQDCRKKALEAAMLFCDNADNATEIKKFADIFYKWLIDIPE